MTDTMQRTLTLPDGTQIVPQRLYPDDDIEYFEHPDGSAGLLLTTIRPGPGQSIDSNVADWETVQHVIVIFYADQEQCRQWNDKIVANMLTPRARAKLLAADPAEWQTTPAWHWWDAMDPPLQGEPCETREEAMRDCLDFFGVQVNH